MLRKKSTIRVKGNDNMKSCIVCGDLLEQPSRDFCDRCLDSWISELEKRYSKRKSPSGPGKGLGEAPASEPEKKSRAFSFLPRWRKKVKLFRQRKKGGTR
jgi:hypothetical protein